MVVDHINHNTLDNRKKNLRICSQHANCVNRQAAKRRSPNRASIFKGVYKTHSRSRGIYQRRERRLWEARIFCKGVRYLLGCYKEEIDAARAYDAKARELFGEFACLNFPNEFLPKQNQSASNGEGGKEAE